VHEEGAAMKKTKDDYHAALMQLVDVIVQVDPADADACLIDVSNDLDAVLDEHHPDFVEAMERVREEHGRLLEQKRKQRSLEKLRATLAKKKALKEGHRDVDR
jgi:hypothetical protein